jgi:cobalt-zinc-cadmium efflux system outer membrane protein
MPRKQVGLALLLLAGVAVWSPPLAAQSAPAPVLSLDDCLRTALANHPLLKASGHRVEAAAARVEQALAFPQPVFSFDSDLQPQPFNFTGSGESYVGVTQTVEFPGRRRVRSDIARREQDAVRTDVDSVRIEVAYGVRQTFYALLRAEERLRHVQQDRDLAADFLKTAETRLAAGDVARVEVVRARVEAAQAANQVQAATAAIRLARAALNVQLGRPQGEALAVTGSLRLPPLTSPVDDIRLIAVASRPEMKRLAFELEAETLRKTQARQSRWPGLDVGFSHHHIAGVTGTWDVSLSLPIPLFFNQAGKGPAAEAQANLLALQRESDHQRHAIELEVETAYVESQVARDQIRLYEDEILTEAEAAFKMLQFSFQQGEIGGLELIAARRTLVTARLGYTDALYNHAVAVAAVDKAAGR